MAGERAGSKSWQEQLRPGDGLRAIVKEATAALILMDAVRLEELARCCADLNRDLQSTEALIEAAAELRSAEQEMSLLGSVLSETRANLTVLSRLRVMRHRANAAPTDGTRGMSAAYQPAERGVNYGDN